MTWKPYRGHRGPRPADTYRGARKKAERGTRISLLLRNERKAEEKAANIAANAPRSKYRLGVHAKQPSA